MHLMWAFRALALKQAQPLRLVGLQTDSPVAASMSPPLLQVHLGPTSQSSTIHVVAAVGASSPQRRQNSAVVAVVVGTLRPGVDSPATLKWSVWSCGPQLALSLPLPMEGWSGPPKRLAFVAHGGPVQVQRLHQRRREDAKRCNPCPLSALSMDRSRRARSALASHPQPRKRQPAICRPSLARQRRARSCQCSPRQGRLQLLWSMPTLSALQLARGRFALARVMH